MDSRTVYIKFGVKDGKIVAQEIDNVSKHLHNMGNDAESSMKKASSHAHGAHGSFKLFDNQVANTAMQMLMLKMIVEQVTGILTAPARAGMSYLGQMETAGLGIATSYMTAGKYIDTTTGKVLQGAQALSAAQADSALTMQDLQVANIQTMATLDQLVKAYQETLPVAMAKGFNRDQVKDYTTAMVQAAGAIGISLDQLGQETRSMLTGDINQDSRIAQVLGLRNEDIKAHMANADELFTFLMGKLEAYTVSGIESQKTWDGLWSNIEDIAKQGLGMAFQPLFEAVKYELMGITGELVTIDEQTKKIKWNQDFLDGVDTVKSGINSMVAEAYRFSMLLDKAGGSMTRLGWLVSGGNFTALGKWFAEQNAMFQQRYMESNDALQALANREAGLDSQGNAVTSKPNTGYQQNAPGKDPKAEEAARRKREKAERDAREISMVMEQIRTRDLLIGKQADEKELLQLDLKHQQEIKRLTENHATKTQLEEAARVQAKERKDLEAHQDEERAYKLAISQAKIAEANFQAQAAWLDKMDAYKLKTGKISEEEAIENKYDRQRQLLDLKSEELVLQIQHEKSEEKRNELEAEYWRIQQQIVRSRQEEGQEIDEIVRKVEQLNAQHAQNMQNIAAAAAESQLQFIGQNVAALDVEFANRIAQAKATYQRELELAGENYQLQLEAKQTYEEQKFQIDQDYALRRAELYWNDAQTYMNYAQQMTTMGIQLLLAEENQRGQIGKRMLAMTIRFLAQQLQQFMFMKAKEHLIAALGAQGRNTLDIVAANANLSILEAQATAWAAFFAAMSLNPYGGQAFIPAATAMTSVAGGVVPGAMAAVNAIGATSMAGEMALAAAWAAGGILVGALGEAGASAIEGGRGGNAAGYGGGTPGSPVVVTNSGGTTASSPNVNQTVNIYVSGNLVNHDEFAREILPAIKKAANDGVH